VRAFADQLQEVNTNRVEPTVEGSLRSNSISTAYATERFIFMHWVTVANAIYMLTSTESGTPRMFRLDIAIEAVE
jgi:hypothetical protein